MYLFMYTCCYLVLHSDMTPHPTGMLHVRADELGPRPGRAEVAGLVYPAPAEERAFCSESLCTT